MMYLGETLSRSTRLFEDQTTSSPAEVEVLRVLAQRGPLVVKEIARAIPGLNLSKLTRVLDKLESEQRITRTEGEQKRLDADLIEKTAIANNLNQFRREKELQNPQKNGQPWLNW